MKRLALTALAAGLGLALCGGEALARGGSSGGGGGRSGGGGSHSGGGGSRSGGYNSSRPAYRPAAAYRPSVRPASPARVTNRPTAKRTVQPQATNRPIQKSISRPQVTRRPDVRPTARPQVTTRPGRTPSTRPQLTRRPNSAVWQVGFRPGSGNGLGRIVTSPSKGNSNYHLTHGRKSHFGFSYHGRHHRHWTHRCWSRHHRCWTYWDGGRRCYYYWCSPDSCFYPVSHCPHGTHCWTDDSYCVTSCPAIDCQSDDPTTVPVEEDSAAESEQGPEYGMRIEALGEGTASDQGMKLGDIIVSLNGQATPDFDALRAALEAPGGSEVDVDFINVDNGQLERVRLYPEDTRIGATVEPVPLPAIVTGAGSDT